MKCRELIREAKDIREKSRVGRVSNNGKKFLKYIEKKINPRNKS